MLSPFALGNVSSSRKTRVLQVAGRRYPGAFFGNVYPQVLEKNNIWIRKASKHFDAKLYPGKSRKSRGSIPEKYKHRFPVVRAAIEVFPTMEVVFQRDENDIRDTFDKRLRREINFALNIEGRK
jgi:hypothetical protein